MTGQIAILIDAQLHNELVLRTRKSADVSGFIEHAIETFLERTEGDEGLWNEDYLEEFAQRNDDAQFEKYGDPQKGYHWQILFLYNGTNLRMTYQGRDYFAEIRHGKLMDGDEERSPSEWARHVANNTNRNAWRDISIQQPGEKEWQLADVLRNKMREGL